MSAASDAFEHAILDAENLLKHFDTLNPKPPTPDLEVLNRAGLIMALTAWETYVEDLLRETAAERLRSVNEPSVIAFVQSKLEDEIKRLHNPTSGKTLELFRDYAGVNITAFWTWDTQDVKTVRDRLDHYIKLRGDVVHRSRAICSGPPQADPVKRDDLRRAIHFLKRLVQRSEEAITPAKARVTSCAT